MIEKRVAEPMFELALFKIRPFTAGKLASLLAGLGRGGMMFVLIIWLQGIYLPIHVLSIGVFFTLIILGLASSLPSTLSHGLIAQGVPSADAAKLATPPT